MKLMRVGISAILAVASLVACTKADNPAETEAKLKNLTLEATAGAATQSVTISDIQATAAKRTWTATVDGKVFHCDADNLFRLPECEPAGQPGA